MFANFIRYPTPDDFPEGVESLPDSIFALPLLECLSVGENSLLELPLGLAQLPGLRYLDISRNLYTEIPPEIGAYQPLEILDVSCNHFVVRGWLL